ncbi:hypothetical protein GCM10012275_16740 [Longimycelium tulufanense]|uniref:Uncharacterized protein n=1 Tax=Longimycelium tulufanense TaxID=907463 RepID=A0A8J3CDZ1_9PSEU|nr:hypothetical protein [Longimycelium tulufanense]GGM46343.1 hypothetical protein GCM10012275_16740 [Longimycelium tulufanense]
MVGFSVALPPGVGDADIDPLRGDEPVALRRLRGAARARKRGARIVTDDGAAGPGRGLARAELARATTVPDGDA